MTNQQKTEISFKIITLSKRKKNKTKQNKIEKTSIKPYTTTRIKSRNFLSNISYVGITKEDFYNRNFVFDVYALVTKNVNPFQLERKISDFNKQEMIYMLWKERIPTEFYKYECLEENFVYLNGKNVLYPKVSEIILNFIQQDEKNYSKLRNNLCQFKSIFQYIYSCVYPEVHCSTERHGFDLKSTFQLVFKTYKDKKK